MEFNNESAPSFQLSSLIGRIIDDRYEVHDLLGQGAMGAVFRATQIRLRRTVALKVPKPHLLGNSGFMGRFEREALTMAKVVHENVVQTHDVFISRDPAIPSFIVMEFVEGPNLDDYVRIEKTTMTVRALVDLLVAAARGLDAAHEMGIVHRDIKPSNIVVTLPKGIPKIMDFGIARVDMDDVFATQDDSIVGTPAFMAPEQVRGGTITPAADVYAFGMMLYRLLTNKFAFDAKAKSDVLVCQIKDPPVPMPQRNRHIPPAAWNALAPALAKDPAERPASATALMAKISEAIAPIEQVTLADLYAGEGPSFKRAAAYSENLAPTSHIGTAGKAAAMAAAPAESQANPFRAPTTLHSSLHSSPTIQDSNPGTGGSLGSYPTLPPHATAVGTHRQSYGMFVFGGIVVVALCLAAALGFYAISKSTPSPASAMASTSSESDAGVTPKSNGGGVDSSASANAPNTEVAQPLGGGLLTQGGAEPTSKQWLNEAEWNYQRNPPLPGGELHEVLKGEIKAVVRALVEDPSAQEEGLVPPALLAALADADRARMIQVFNRMRANLGERYERLEMHLPMANQSVIWEDHAIAVFTILISGVPKGETSPDARERGLFESENALRLKMVKSGDEWTIEAAAFEPPLPQGTRGPTGPQGAPGGTGPQGRPRPMLPRQ
ncbi:MAG: eukaryotic-like serine/threonine-protein kinase [Candidatus Sumerlaeota bacterium]|nr:eukaryotic-like serine/threonine-protein kinase [Candidatus Sumerlaeota bacterium]